jgi:hypothetical protein
MKGSTAIGIRRACLPLVATLSCLEAAAGQAPPADSTLLWPAWRTQLSAVGLGPGTNLAPMDLAPDEARCVAAGRVGFAGGLLADIVWRESIEFPRGLDFYAGHSWRFLDRWGSLLGRALACPSPLARFPVSRPDSIARSPARR